MISQYWSVLIAVHILLITVGKCQWALDVQLYQFENKHNAEFEQDEFCCCDSGDCVNNLIDLRSDCFDGCDTWFNVSVDPCTANEEMSCFVSTESELINDSPRVGKYGYNFHLTTNTPPKTLSIIMMEKNVNGESNLIDRFIVMLSMISANLITSYTGEKDIAVIELSYQIHCMYLDDCPSTSLSPERTCTSMTTIFIETAPTAITMEDTTSCFLPSTIIKFVTVETVERASTICMVDTTKSTPETTIMKSVSTAEICTSTTTITMEAVPTAISSEDIEKCSSESTLINFVTVEAVHGGIAMEGMTKSTAPTTIMKSVIVTNTNNCMTGEFASPLPLTWMAVSGIFILITAISIVMSIILCFIVFRTKTATKIEKAHEEIKYNTQVIQPPVMQAQQMPCSDNVAYSSFTLENRCYVKSVAGMQDDGHYYDDITKI